MAGIVAAALGQSTTGLDIATDWGDTRHSWSDPMEELGVPQSRFRAPWILVAAAGVLLTACGGGGGGGSSGNSAPVKVGYLVPLSGNFASNGKNEENGFELGLKDFGSTVNGHKIQVTYL